MTPTVSVLMAVFNGSLYLRPAVESILAQTFTDFEFIAIDDGSTDETAKVLRYYAAKDSRIRVVSRPNKGLTATLNEGVNLARGEFLARIDADDVAMPQRFELQVKYLREHPDTVLLGSRVVLIDPDGLPIRTACTETTHEQIDHAHLNRGWPVVHPAVMMRTDAVRKVGAYRNEYDTLEDLDLFLRLAEVGQLANLPEVLLRYRQHFGSVTHRRFELQAKLRQAIFDETYARRGATAPPPVVLTPPKPKQRFEQHRHWAWDALKSGNVKTARKHAALSLKDAPLSMDSWRLFACAVRGH